MQRQRAKGRYGLDNPRQALGADHAIEAQDFAAQLVVDRVAEFDGQRAVADRQETHGHFNSLLQSAIALS